MARNTRRNNNSLKRVLIVDEEDNMRYMLKTMLTKAGYLVNGACDGVQALESLTHNHFDLILCDIRMPEMDGMQFLKVAQKRFPEKKIIMMSAYATIETALEAMKMGAYDYISKPFKSDEVLLTLKKGEERGAARARIKPLPPPLQALASSDLQVFSLH